MVNSAVLGSWYNLNGSDYLLTVWYLLYDIIQLQTFVEVNTSFYWPEKVRGIVLLTDSTFLTQTVVVQFLLYYHI
jgi:hypothetical protein